MFKYLPHLIKEDPKMPSQTIEELREHVARELAALQAFDRLLECNQRLKGTRERVQERAASVRAECERRMAEAIEAERVRGAAEVRAVEQELEGLVPLLEHIRDARAVARAFLNVVEDDSEAELEEEEESARGGGVTPDPAPSVKVALGASVQFIAPDQIVGGAQCGACFRVGAWTPDESGTVHTRACAGHAGAAAQPPSARWLANLDKHPVRAAPAPTSPASLKRARTPDASELECEKCSTRAGHTVTHARAQFPTYKKTKGDGSVVLGLRGSCEASIAEERRARDAAKKSTPPQN